MGAEEKAAASVAQPCMLGYPDRYHAAAKFIKLAPPGLKPLSHEVQLTLYALQQQADVGPCKSSKPGGWGWGNVEEGAKWQAWKGLGNISSVEAMRLYVRTVEEEEANWYGMLLQAEANQPAEATKPNSKAGSPASAVEYAEDGCWTPLPIEAVAGGDPDTPQPRKPVPRYEHGAALIGKDMFVVGGNYGGRYLPDVWKLDVTTLQWSSLQTHPYKEPKAAESEGSEGAGEQQANGGGDAPAKPSPVPHVEGLGPCAGHSVTAWKDALIIIGGHVKAQARKPEGGIAVRLLDTSTGEMATVTPKGDAPAARGGHTATLLGRRIFVFGGEDAHRKGLGDLWVLDVETMSWSSPETTGKGPSPRSAHVAASYQSRYLLIFGGGSVATCFNDLYVLDTHSVPMQWSSPHTVGLKVSPRAGHTAVIVDDTWYIVGGGNNVKGCTDMLALDLRNLGSGPLAWHSVASIPPRDPLSSEGISLVAVPAQLPGGELRSVLLAFGGYNGKYQNVASVMRAPAHLPQLAEAVSKQSAGGASGASPSGKAGKAEAAPTAAPVTEAPTAQEAGAKASTAPAAATAATAAAAVAPAWSGSSSAAVADGAAVAAVAELRVALEAARRDAEGALREAASAKESAGHELALLRKQLSAAHSALAEAQKGWEDAKAALAKESAKVLKLQAEAAEMQRQLAAVQELEKEVEAYRRAAKEAESKKGSGGLWGYIAGGSS
mmetsp:Transcript_31138/g.69212  ORF Transcript_31138/g.69212 Transcript_31138/m.69212 type:complete len:720 (-) Transcript_31138:447-2606(-)|eukprot:CAMPEP_0202903410 /NCGR_PEP_ID=MMETSP1392-20130828/24284_1 /ASSEMBLY_ACC=CAM_ASM_000868 /TAXON_ID=225041 /ORGANISM="Chlamydomonas chlamydogama, Strain SAG 11-48b" /LENGTH=719 /DNA_ID=CAMNT_0049590573 /DNA_START=190 /DNA_END=2349 /DNA_ORIENTATION=-